MNTWSDPRRIVLAFMIGSVLACSAGPDNRLVIGLSLNSLKDPFLLTLKQHAEQAAREAGVTLVVTKSQANLARQISAVEDLIQRGVDVLGLNPLDASGIIPAVEAANAAGIPVITVDTDAAGGRCETFD